MRNPCRKNKKQLLRKTQWAGANGFCRFLSFLRGLAVLAALPVLLSCGVRGDPQPPLEPTPIGRGRPTFQKRMKELDVRLKGIPKKTEKKKETEDTQ